MKNKPIYCWDANIFIAWLKNEQRPAGEMDGVAEVAAKVERNEAVLMSSVILNTELLECKLPNGAMRTIENVFKRRNIQLKNCDGRITSIAQNLRNYYSQLNDGLPTLTSNDAVFLATAILYKADQFHTFDNGKKGGRSLLSLNGNVAGHNLVVCKPPVTQYRLPGI